MQLGAIGRTLLGGSILYVVMVACAASDRSSSGATDRNDGGSGGDESSLADASIGPSGGGDGHGGDPTDGTGGGWLDAALDAITDPVPDAAADDGTKDGSRLKARYYVADDGARQFAGWFDTQRGEECTFQLAGDGKRRCLPTPQTLGTLSYYQDAECTQPIVSGTCGTGYVGIWDIAMGCANGSRLRVYANLGAYTGTYIYLRSGSACTAFARGDASFVRVGTEIPASSFVGANVQ